MSNPGPARLPRHLLPAVMLMAMSPSEPPSPSSGMADMLARWGLTADGRLAPPIADLVAVMTDAQLVISLERRSADLPYQSTIWARCGEAVWGRPASSDLFELRTVDPIELPLLLAQLTDVGRRPRPPFVGSCTLDGALLDAVSSDHHDHETALGILVGNGLDPMWADRLMIALDHRRAEWTVSSVWTDVDGSHGFHELTVLDAGPAGYWHIEPADDGSGVRYTVGSLETVMRSLRQCIPGWCAAPV